MNLNAVNDSLSLNTITDSNLIERTESLVREEREILTKVLHHLREIDRRRLFSSLGYKSLFDFTVRRLGYPEDQAYRRISAMKLLKEIPEIEEKINRGEISLTHIGLAQTLFRQERKIQQKEMSSHQKLSVLEKIANKSVREAERIAFSLNSTPGVPVKPDRMNAVSENLIELKFIASIELQKKIEHLKGFLAHKHPNISLGELFERLCDLGLAEWTPGPRSIKSPRSFITKSQVLREVFQKAKNRCEKCGSHYALEVDHILPRAKGGSSNAENLRLLCRSCNQRAAINEFGLQKMDRHMNGGSHPR